MHLAAAVANCALAGVLVALTFALPGSSIPGAAVWLVFGLTFPIFAAALLPVALSQPRTRFSDFGGRRVASRTLWAYARGRVPRRVAIGIAAVFLLGWLAGMSGLVQDEGQPERHGGRYYANDHGRLMPLTKQAYDQQLGYGYRGFTAMPMALCAVAVGLILVGRVPLDDIPG